MFAARGRTTVAFLVAVSFLNTMGIGLVLPVLPFLVANFVAAERVAALVTALAALYAAASFVAAPVLGGWSDRFGRKPILN